MHVVVIGAGLVGLSSALWLARSGHRVTVVDRRPPAPGVAYDHACSYGNACSIALHACIPVATPGIARKVPGMLLDPLGPLALRWGYLPQLARWLWHFVKASDPAEVERIGGVLAGLLAQVNAGYDPLVEEAGAGDLFRHQGCLYLYRSAAEFAAAEAEIAFRRRHGVRLTVLDATAIRALEPNLAPLYHRGLMFDDAYSVVSPHRLALAFAAAIGARGGDFVAGEAVLGRDLTVVIGGTVLRPDRVVVAGGSWSRTLAAQIGDDILLDTERGYHVMFPGQGDMLTRPVCYPGHGFYLTPMADGLRAVGTVELGGLRAAPDWRRSDVIAGTARRLLPGLAEPDGRWMGFRPSMPDSLPVIGASPRDARVVYAFGHGHIGLTLAGITGRLVGQIVDGATPSIDLAPFRPDRF